MKSIVISIVLLGALLLSSCGDRAAEEKSTGGESTASTPAVENTVESVSPDSRSTVNVKYESARQKIIYGNASLAEVRLALTEKDPAALTNTMHALYSMRWHRGVFKLLYLMWEMDKELYPELNWEEIGKAPARLALASTLNRIQIADTKTFQSYIRSFQYHEHEFIRAQVVVALGFNGDPGDVAYLRSMADGDNAYVAQSAIAGLGLMNNPEAKDALVELGKTYKNTERGAVINGMLRDAYKIVLKESLEQQERTN